MATWNGLSKGKKITDFDEKQIKKGMKIEMEHTRNKKMAQRIAMDHLVENPKYYTYLEKMERKMDMDMKKLKK